MDDARIQSIIVPHCFRSLRRKKDECERLKVNGLVTQVFCDCFFFYIFFYFSCNVNNVRKFGFWSETVGRIQGCIWGGVLLVIYTILFPPLKVLSDSQEHKKNACKHISDVILKVLLHLPNKDFLFGIIFCVSNFFFFLCRISIFFFFFGVESLVQRKKKILKKIGWRIFFFFFYYYYYFKQFVVTNYK